VIAMQKPRVILLVAVRTLCGAEGSVGQAYATVAQRFGLEADAEALNTAFFEQFKAADPMAFPGSDPTDIPAQEYAWWRTIAEKTFQKTGYWEQLKDFEAFFADLYAYFAGADPWFVYPDAYHSLERWRSQDIEMGIISNFDSRIYTVLDSLALADFFTSITLSTEVGAAKPDSQIFTAALKKHGCQPSEAWHVGDSYRDDYEGARTAGIRGIWLKRPGEVAS
jgi:putative hydrolase of the HAD superfamily